MPMHPLKSGDRVVRPIVFDDGTWARLGDVCLTGSAMRRGIVISCRSGPQMSEYRVAWDDGQVGTYLRHGIERAPEDTD